MSVSERERSFAFPDTDSAQLFVTRLCNDKPYLRDLAIFRNGKVVRVIDGSEDGQGSEIIRRARMSGLVRRVL